MIDYRSVRMDKNDFKKTENYMSVLEFKEEEDGSSSEDEFGESNGDDFGNFEQGFNLAEKLEQDPSKLIDLDLVNLL